MANSDIDFNNTTNFGTVKILMLQGAKGEKGDDGISGDYDGLINKPQINGVELDGNKTSDDLGLASATGLATAQGNISTLQSDMTTAKGNISTLMPTAWTKIKDGLWARKRNDIVDVLAQGASISYAYQTSGAARYKGTLGTLPSGFRPSLNLLSVYQFSTARNTKTYPASIDVSSAGVVTIYIDYPTSGDDHTTYEHLFFSFPVNVPSN